jgi:hypothetical protein
MESKLGMAMEKATYEANKLAAEIDQLIENEKEGKNLNWSTVGTMQHVVELLKETKAFMLGKEVKDL